MVVVWIRRVYWSEVSIRVVRYDFERSTDKYVGEKQKKG